MHPQLLCENSSPPSHIKRTETSQVFPVATRKISYLNHAELAVRPPTPNSSRLCRLREIRARVLRSLSSSRDQTLGCLHEFSDAFGDRVAEWLGFGPRTRSSRPATELLPSSWSKFFKTNVRRRVQRRQCVDAAFARAGRIPARERRTVPRRWNPDRRGRRVEHVEGSAGIAEEWYQRLLGSAKHSPVVVHASLTLDRSAAAQVDVQRSQDNLASVHHGGIHGCSRC